jgi:DmsE family decaheme c-type cytochrome
MSFVSVSGRAEETQPVAHGAGRGAAVLSLASGDYAAGVTECIDCHDEAAELSVLKTPHGQSRHPFEREHACEVCHGPGAAHVDDNDVPVPVVFGDDSLVREQIAVCTSCHARDAERAFWKGSPHERNDVPCTACHSIHRGRGSASLAEDGAGQPCLGCHAEQRVALLSRGRHPLRERAMDCWSCHAPHGSAAGHTMLVGNNVFDTCTGCHAEVRGPFLWEHPPVRENCLNCHDAHGSNHEALLQTFSFRLCQSCHMQGRHQTIAGSPDRFFMTNRACMNCHSQVHGSNHPSGAILQR